MLSVRIVLFSTFLLSNLVAFSQVREAIDTAVAPGQGKVMDADPFEAGTGIYFREHTDLVVKDSIPIEFVRTQRNMDSRSRAFGIGASTSYDMFIIGDVKQFSWVALVLANGSQVRYARTSPGTGYADGVFLDVSDPSEFLGSRISWNGHGGWTVKMRDGREYTVQGCNASSKPGQCAVTEIKNSQGERLVIQRDGEGNILRITSPHGHFISMRNDSEGRILHAQDDSGKWASYRYDDHGCLIETTNWRRDRQEFRYDSKFNMVYVHEWGPNGSDGEGPYNFTISNKFNEQDRFSSQRVSTGDIWSAEYHVDDQGHVRQTDVRDNTSLIRYFFDEAGYSYREEFEPRNQQRWVLDYAREPKTREILGVTLSCPLSQRHLPGKFAELIGEMGEAHKAFVSQMCREILPQPNADAGTRSSF